MNISEIKDLLAQFDASTLREFSYKNNGEELNLSYVRLYSEQPSLDDVFLAYTGKGLRDR